MQFLLEHKKTFVVGVLIFLISSSLTFAFFASKEKEVSPEVLSLRQEVEKQNLVNEVDTVLEPEQERTDLLLPDMSIKTPVQLYIAGNQSSKKLRFNTTFVNLGPGPLEVLGHSDLENGLTHAAQYIFAKGAPGEYRNIGSFELHPTHNHWHVANHVRYQLWSINEQGQEQTMLADTGKMSFCLWDEHTNDLTIPGAPQTRVYARICNRVTQGMSVGWGDTYAANVDGQELDITNIPDGEYILRFEVNPDRKIYEVTYDNNLGELRVKIAGFKVTPL